MPPIESIKRVDLGTVDELPEREGTPSRERQPLFQNSKIVKEMSETNGQVPPTESELRQDEERAETRAAEAKTPKVMKLQDDVFNEKLEMLFLKSVEHEHKQIFFEKNRIVSEKNDK